VNPWEEVDAALGFLQLQRRYPPRRAELRPGGLPVRIKDTPYLLRMVNSSGFEAQAHVALSVEPWPEQTLRIELTAKVLTFERGSTNTFVAVLPSDGTGSAEWFAFQEARRKRRKGTGEWRIGPAMFRFEIFTPKEV
jgi:hypothetical protein